MSRPAENNECVIDLDDATLKGFLDIPPDPLGIVVFAHGSGSSRFSKRNNAVAAYLREAQLGTLLFDLLTADEDQIDAVTREYRFDIPLLSKRLEGAVRWLRQLRRVAAELPFGLFGSSTGAAAALIVAAAAPDEVAAVVSRGGRADLAGESLGGVLAPTLLIVGGADREVLRLNEAAQAQMRGSCELAIVDHATHLFEEPGALEQVAHLTRNWFVDHFEQSGATADP